MRARSVLLLVWLVTGFGAVAGSMLGAAINDQLLPFGALVGGAAAAVAATFLSVRLGWLPRIARRAASVGAVIGFFGAALVAVANLDTPVIPVLICSLAGVGALVGAGRTRAG